MSEQIHDFGKVSGPHIARDFGGPFTGVAFPMPAK